MEEQVISKKRVLDHGEVFTNKREVNAMLDLVKQETERIESRFLEPACGTGNFLVEILGRKLQVVETRYAKNQVEYERYAVLAVSSIYGIDILQDNAIACRERLFEIFNQPYTIIYSDKSQEKCRQAVKYILDRNIIWGNALTLKTIGENSQPITFSEWSPVNSNMLKRRDFTFKELLSHASIQELPLFSDLGEDVFLPDPVKEFPLIHFMRVADAE
ncbi:MAG TPA: restriction endonuclease subunit M [Candidatus Atribacteria bacterium]|nr:restriction endonuclease subunit M [Candidatus Atribacteria bacterium]